VCLKRIITLLICNEHLHIYQTYCAHSIAVLSFKAKIERHMGRRPENRQFRVSYTQKREDLTVKSKVKRMSERIKTLGVFALLGFVGGIAANIGFHTVWPWLVVNFPLIFSAEWVVSGLAGALITTFFVVIWVYLSKPSAE